jgi:ketosteroid isomerase-like protein
MDVAELIARESIRDLVARYVHAADRGRFDELAGLFTEDGVLALPDGREVRGAEAILAYLGATAASMRGATSEAWIRHHVSSHRIVLDALDEALGYAYFLVVTARGPDHWGRYADRYVRVGDRWLFAHRRVRVDGVAPGSFAADRRRS